MATGRYRCEAWHPSYAYKACLPRQQGTVTLQCIQCSVKGPGGENIPLQCTGLMVNVRVGGGALSAWTWEKPSIAKLWSVPVPCMVTLESHSWPSSATHVSSGILSLPSSAAHRQPMVDPDGILHACSGCCPNAVLVIMTLFSKYETK